MIPVSLYGVDVNRCESFYDKLPGLVADSIDDEEYSDALFCLLYTSPSPRDIR